jgi:hypothetical protein
MVTADTTEIRSDLQGRTPPLKKVAQDATNLLPRSFWSSFVFPMEWKKGSTNFCTTTWNLEIGEKGDRARRKLHACDPFVKKAEYIHSERYAESTSAEHTECSSFSQKEWVARPSRVEHLLSCRKTYWSRSIDGAHLLHSRNSLVKKKRMKSSYKKMPCRISNKYAKSRLRVKWT